MVEEIQKVRIRPPLCIAERGIKGGEFVTIQKGITASLCYAVIPLGGTLQSQNRPYRVLFIFPKPLLKASFQGASEK